MNTIDNIKKKYLNICDHRKSEISKEPKAPFIWKNQKNIHKDTHTRGTIIRWYEGILAETAYSKYIKWYTLTIDPLDPTVQVTEHQYELALKRLRDKCKTIIKVAYIYETSEHGKLHLHGILATRDKTKFLKVKHDIRYHYQMDPLTYLDGWICYILKGSPENLYTRFPN